MAKIETVSCDNCGKLKGENNHWWLIDANISHRVMFIHPSNTNHLVDRDYSFVELIACGLECLAILESKVKEGKNPLR
jgi:hypothetical protein